MRARDSPSQFAGKHWPYPRLLVGASTCHFVKNGISPPSAVVRRVAHLGDAHNFGRRVTQRPTRIAKPRTLLWEWLLLCAESPLRELLVGSFDFLPSLGFSSPFEPGGGEVERVRLKPLVARSAESKRTLARIVGEALALFSWLGVSDLHWENLVLGVGEGGRSRQGRRVVFAPLDVEMILADLCLPTETKLLPDADPEVAAICRHACGVRRVLPYLGKPVPAELVVLMADAYRRALDVLDLRARAIADVFARLPHLGETPIRVLLRGTDEYVRARTEPVWPPLLDAESQQLARGDIPYFFRLYGRPGIHFYANEALTRVEHLPLRGDVPRLDPILSLSRGLRSPSRRKLRDDGLFAVLGAFDHPSIKGRYESEDLVVTYGARTLTVRLPGGDELQTRRDLRAFVGSVYLPCRCGEVRTAFAPPVTTCGSP